MSSPPVSVAPLAKLDEETDKLQTRLCRLVGQAIADYRRMMGLSYADLCELELAYLDQDADKVDEVMTKIKAGKKEGHKKYSDDYYKQKKRKSILGELFDF